MAEGEGPKDIDINSAVPLTEAEIRQQELDEKAIAHNNALIEDLKSKPESEQKEAAESILKMLADLAIHKQDYLISGTKLRALQFVRSGIVPRITLAGQVALESLLAIGLRDTKKAIIVGQLYAHVVGPRIEKIADDKLDDFTSDLEKHIQNLIQKNDPQADTLRAIWEEYQARRGRKLSKLETDGISTDTTDVPSGTEGLSDQAVEFDPTVGKADEGDTETLATDPNGVNTDQPESNIANLEKLKARKERLRRDHEVWKETRDLLNSGDKRAIENELDTSQKILELYVDDSESNSYPNDIRDVIIEIRTIIEDGRYLPLSDVTQSGIVTLLSYDFMEFPSLAEASAIITYGILPEIRQGKADDALQAVLANLKGQGTENALAIVNDIENAMARAQAKIDLAETERLAAIEEEKRQEEEKLAALEEVKKNAMKTEEDEEASDDPDEAVRSNERFSTLSNNVKRKIEFMTLSDAGKLVLEEEVALRPRYLAGNEAQKLEQMASAEDNKKFSLIRQWEIQVETALSSMRRGQGTDKETQIENFMRYFKKEASKYFKSEDVEYVLDYISAIQTELVQVSDLAFNISARNLAQMMEAAGFSIDTRIRDILSLVSSEAKVRKFFENGEADYVEKMYHGAITEAALSKAERIKGSNLTPDEANEILSKLDFSTKVRTDMAPGVLTLEEINQVFQNLRDQAIDVLWRKYEEDVRELVQSLIRNSKIDISQGANIDSNTTAIYRAVITGLVRVGKALSASNPDFVLKSTKEISSSVSIVSRRKLGDIISEDLVRDVQKESQAIQGVYAMRETLLRGSSYENWADEAARSFEPSVAERLYRNREYFIAQEIYADTLATLIQENNGILPEKFGLKGDDDMDIVERRALPKIRAALLEIDDKLADPKQSYILEQRARNAMVTGMVLSFTWSQRSIVLIKNSIPPQVSFSEKDGHAYVSPSFFPPKSKLASTIIFSKIDALNWMFNAPNDVPDILSLTAPRDHEAYIQAGGRLKENWDYRSVANMRQEEFDAYVYGYSAITAQMRKDYCTLAEHSTPNFAGQAERGSKRLGMIQATAECVVKNQDGVVDVAATMLRLRRFGIPFMIDYLLDLKNLGAAINSLSSGTTDDVIGAITDDDAEVLRKYQVQKKSMDELEKKAAKETLVTNLRSLLTTAISRTREKNAQSQYEQAMPKFKTLERQAQIIVLDAFVMQYAQRVAPVRFGSLLSKSQTPDLEIDQKKTFRDIMQETILTESNQHSSEMTILVEQALIPVIRDSCVTLESVCQDDQMRLIQDLHNNGKEGDALMGLAGLKIDLGTDSRDTAARRTLRRIYAGYKNEILTVEVNGIKIEKNFYTVLGASTAEEGEIKFIQIVEKIYAGAESFYAVQRREHYGTSISSKLFEIRKKGKELAEYQKLVSRISELEAIASDISLDNVVRDRAEIDLEDAQSGISALRRQLGQVLKYVDEVRSAGVNLGTAGMYAGNTETYSRRLARLVEDDKFGEGGMRVFGIIDGVGELSHRQDVVNQGTLDQNLAVKYLKDLKWESDMNDAVREYWGNVVDFVRENYKEDEKLKSAVEGKLIPPLKKIVDLWEDKDRDVARRMLFYLFVYTERAISKPNKLRGSVSGPLREQQMNDQDMLYPSFLISHESLRPAGEQVRFSATTDQMRTIIAIINNDTKLKVILSDEPYKRVATNEGEKTRSEIEEDIDISLNYGTAAQEHLIKDGKEVKVKRDRFSKRHLNKALSLDAIDNKTDQAITVATDIGASTANLWSAVDAESKKYK